MRTVAQPSSRRQLPQLFQLLLLLGLLAATPELSAQQETLISTGSVWRWRKGTNEVSTPITAWRTNGFNDAAWLTGSAPFHYGDGLTGGTLLSDMRSNYPCIYLRRTFVVTNVAEVQSMRFVTAYDDGFVAWINGTEVARALVAPLHPPYNTNASGSHEATTTQTFTPTNSPASYLITGTNVLAVQAFNVNRNTSTDFRFETSLEAARPATPLPSITLHPQSQTNCAGTAAIFTAAATGTPTPTAQWQVSTNGGGAWASVGGAISITYSPASVMGNNGNLYRAVFSNAGGATNTSAAMLTVNSGPVAVTFSTNAAPNQHRVIDVAGLLAACTALEGNAFFLSAVAPLSTNGAPVTITPTNTIVYQPRTGFTGTDRFDYTITDLLGCSATAAVQMAVGP